MTVTHHTFDRKPRSAGRFGSKIEAFRSRMPVHWCLQCDRPCGDDRGSKGMFCTNCGSKAQYFASTGEHRRYLHLAMRRNAGEITNLVLQPAFPVLINGIRVCTYRGDYQYQDVRTGKTVIEDFKGSKDHQDNASKLRRKAAEAAYGITVTIIEG